MSTVFKDCFEKCAQARLCQEIAGRAAPAKLDWNGKAGTSNPAIEDAAASGDELKAMPFVEFC
jgi:hypothetical protein